MSGSNKWIPCTDVVGVAPPPRGHHNAVFVGSKLYVFGRFDKDSNEIHDF